MSCVGGGSCSLRICAHVILATSTVSCACIVAICTNRNKALVRSSRAFTVPSIGLQTWHQTTMLPGGDTHVLTTRGTCPGIRAFADGRTTMKHFILSIALSVLVIVAV